MVLDGLPGLYGLKYDSAIACGLPLYLCSYKLVGSATSPASIMVIVRGSWPFPGGEPKGTLVDCSWLVWSSSCVGCAAPYWGFGMWCQLAREPPSEWIATTRSSLPVSKLTSIKIIMFIIWFRGDWSSLVFILVIDWLLWWLAHSSTRRYSTPSFLRIYIFLV